MTPTAPDSYTVRRFQPEDAAGVTDLVRRVYGETYLHPELYHPEELVLLNQTDENVSIVALDANGKVVGHYAILWEEHGSIAETGEAMVNPEHRNHHLLHRMRTLLEEEAHRLGLHGMYSQSVTVHPFSQKAVEAFGSIPCGLVLGLSPKTTRIGPEPLTQRLSAVLHFKYLRPVPVPVVHAPPRHHSILRRIYEQLGLTPEFTAGQAPQGRGRIEVKHNPTQQSGSIKVLEVGADTAAAVAGARRELVEQTGAEVVHLDVPLNQPATANLVPEAEAVGFFFTGLGPLFAGGGDTLRMEYLAVELDLGRLQIASPFARELLNYVAAERERVGKRET